MNEQDIKDNFQKMLSYCNEISRTPESYGYTWFMVDDYDDGTGRPIIQLCIPLIPIDSKKIMLEIRDDISSRISI